MATPAFIQRMKHPMRGGQNLTQRYRTLERTLRGKRALVEEQEAAQDAQHQTSVSSHTGSNTSTKPSTTTTFHGLVIPKRPREPESDECCMSGCAICVYDLYNDALETYNESLSKIQTSLTAMRVPKAEWPLGLRTSAKPDPESSSGRSSSASSLGVFEEMERALREKREREREREQERAGVDGGDAKR